MTSNELEPENWLTYRGDHRGSVGMVMGPATTGQVSTVVAADYDADAGRTRLGLVTGDVRSEIGRPAVTAGGWDAGAA